MEEACILLVSINMQNQKHLIISSLTCQDQSSALPMQDLISLTPPVTQDKAPRSGLPVSEVI